MRHAVRSLVVLILSACFLLLISSPVFAQTDKTTNNIQTNLYTTPNTASNVPKNLHTWTQTVMIEVLSAMTCQLTGIDPANSNQKCLGVDQRTGQIGFVENGGGAIGFMGNMIAMLYNPPIHTNDYFNYLAQNFGIVKPAYAQGVGFQGLSPLIKLWSVSRNIVYLFFVIIFVVIGLTIMLRVKIDARTVMAIENQIPKLIIALILVTFSFAIVGFLIDLMYVVIYLIFNIFTNPDILSPKSLENVGKVHQSFNGDSPLGVFNNLVDFKDVVTYSSGGVKDIVTNLFSNPNYAVAPQQWWEVWKWVDDWLNGLRNFGTMLFGYIAGVLALLIISIAILWAMFRLWFQLISSYVYLLIDVVLAPFFIITGVFPGGLGFGGWLRDVLSNLAPFPTTMVLFLLGRAFMDSFAGSNNQLWVAPLVGNTGDAQAIGSIIGLGIILLAPQVVTMMKEALKAPKFNVSSIGQAVGIGAGAGPGVMNFGTGVGNTLFGLSRVPGIGRIPIIGPMALKAGGVIPNKEQK